MTIAQDLLEILVCPETRQPVSLAPSELIQELEAKRAAGGLKNHHGEALEEPIEAGLVREDGGCLYLIQDGDIPNMIIDERIDLVEAAQAAS
ncbi:MAG: hypothetical protein AAF533_00355 [Acidobacteriota bacterium]